MQLASVAEGFATLVSCEGAYSVVLTLFKHTPVAAQPAAEAAVETADGATVPDKQARPKL